MRWSTVSLVLVVAFLVSACSSASGVCTTQGSGGVLAEIRDACTGAPAAEGATLVVRGVASVDSAIRDGRERLDSR